MKKLSNLLELQAEAEHKSQDGPIENYGIVKIKADEVSVHILLDGDKITWHKFPSENFKLSDSYFEEGVNKEKENDFLKTNLSADGFFVSSKAKSILEKFNLGQHKFYKSNVVIKKGGFLKKATKQEYYWLHLVFNDQTDEFVDFSDSIFKERISKAGKLISSEETKYISAEELHSYKTKKHQIWKSNPDDSTFHKVIAWELALTKNDLPDILGFSSIDSGEYYFSKDLANALKVEGIKGIQISKTGKIKS